MGWECSSLVNPSVAAFLLHGLSSGSNSTGCPSSYTLRTAHLDRTAGIVAAAASRGRRWLRRCVSVRARLDGSPDGSQQQEQQLNFSVLRFTLGIPGLDESYLPRYIGYAFGSLIILNHFLGSSGSPAPAQLRSEALGICLAGFSIALPYFGKFLKIHSFLGYCPRVHFQYYCSPYMVPLTQMVAVQEKWTVSFYWHLVQVMRTEIVTKLG